MIFDPETMDATACYKLLIGSIVPRAIGWASTLSADGVANLAPFSFFTAVSRKPPMLEPEPSRDLDPGFSDLHLARGRGG
jgi:flavin reductase (DIM6/NTAB) family NADH-FMN oxidoreductase RutF